MQFSHRRVLDDVWVGGTGAEIHLRLADADTCGCSPASCGVVGKGRAITWIWVWMLEPAWSCLGTCGLLPG